VHVYYLCQDATSKNDLGGAPNLKILGSLNDRERGRLGRGKEGGAREEGGGLRNELIHAVDN
jgi:hypothetical protein